MKPYFFKICIAINLIHRLFSASRINRRNFPQASRIENKLWLWSLSTNTGMLLASYSIHLPGG